MIEFNKIRVKNFMSYGNSLTEVNLKSGKVLVTGGNGSGKSSIWLDGIMYAMFGKPFRNIKIPQLINSVNQKECLVEIDFNIGPDTYMVRRGMKPSKLEIYQNGELLKQDAATKDYQGFLEKNILKINRKTFTQILILGSARFVPFMQQPLGARREIIEDIFDITVFGSMHKLLKTRIEKTKDELTLIEVKLNSSKRETLTQKKLIDTLSMAKDDRLNDLKTEQITSTERLNVLIDEIKDLSLSAGQIQSDILNLGPDSDDIDYKVSNLTSDIEKVKVRLLNITQMDVCPTCTQTVSETHKHTVDASLRSRIDEYTTQLVEYNKTLSSIKKVRERRFGLESSLRDVNVELKLKRNERDNLETTLNQIDTKIKDMTSESHVNISIEKDKLKEIAETALEFIKRKNVLINEQHLQKVSLTLLKDSGIKASIVREYLPILNTLINKYLTEFEFFVNFELDDNFNEVIKSRGRDEFSYESFSEGEKKRIDMAVLMSFRQIASMKNSVKVNLMVCDEVDNGLDPAALEKYVDLIIKMDAHAWVISHVIANTELTNQFGEIVKVEKRGEFSIIDVKEENDE